MPSDSDEGEVEPRYSRILTAVADSPWAILPQKLAVIVDLLALRATGARLTADEVRERIGAAAQQPAPRMSGSVAVLPLFGTLIPRADLMTEMSGGMGLERWTARFKEAVADSTVGSIVIDVDSPGGSVYGVEEAANAVYAARGSKPIVAVADTLAASAAYWIATQADELIVSPSAELGSIGVFGAHEDMSAALEKLGVRVTLISAGKFKVEGNPYEPLGDEARAAMQSRVDDYYAAFTKAVARGRGVSAGAVRSGFGQGRVVGAQEAVKLGMADQVATFEDTLRRVASGKRLNTGRTAATVALIPTATPVDLSTIGTGDTTTIIGVYGGAEPSAEDMAEIEPEAEAARAESAAGLSLDLRRRRLRRRALA